MIGTISYELEVNVAASQAWELYGTLELAKLIGKQLSSVVTNIDIIGDGAVGTVLKITFAPGALAYSYYAEKFTKVDHEKRVKETEVVEGGFLDLGFTLYRVRFEVIEKSEEINCCITKVTIEYELKKEFAANISLVNIPVFVIVVDAAATELTQNKINAN